MAACVCVWGGGCGGRWEVRALRAGVEAPGSAAAVHVELASSLPTIAGASEDWNSCSLGPVFIHNPEFVQALIT